MSRPSSPESRPSLASRRSARAIFLSRSSMSRSARALRLSTNPSSLPLHSERGKMLSPGGKMLLPGLSSHFSGVVPCSSGISWRPSGGSRRILRGRAGTVRRDSRHEEGSRIASVAIPCSRERPGSNASGRPASEGVPRRLGNPRLRKLRLRLRIEGVPPLMRSHASRDGGGRANGLGGTPRFRGARACLGGVAALEGEPGALGEGGLP